MHLVRLGGAECQKSESAVYRKADTGTVQVLFREFGLGEERTNDFRVDLAWEDIEKLILEFAVMKERRAVALQQAQGLASAVEKAGWKSPNEISN